MALNALGLGLLFTAKDLASGVMQNVRNGFAQTRNEMGRFGNRSDQAFKQFGTGVKMMGAGLGGLALALATTGAAADFDKRIAEISTLTEEATLNTDFLSKEVLSLNAAYGGGTAKQAKALYDGISAGAANASEAHALLTASNKLAVAGVTEVNVALDGLTSSLNAYGVSFAKAGEFSDSMFTAVRSGKVTIAELSAVIGHVAPTASALGVSFDELNAALAAITNKGIKADMAATGLQAALANIIKPSSDAAAEAARLGVKFTAAALRANGFSGLLRQVTSSSKFNADSMSKLFSSVEGLRTILALTAEGGTKFNGALDAMKSKTGRTDEAFKVMSQHMAGQRFEGLKENALILIGQALLPLRAAMYQTANAVLEAFTKLPKPFRDLMVRAFAVASAVMAVVGAVVAAKAGFVILAAAAKTFGVAAGGSLLSALWPALLIIGLITVAVLAFKYAVDNDLDGIGATFHRFAEGVSLAWEALGQLFSQGGFSGRVRDEFMKGDNAFIGFAVKVYLVVNRIQNFLSALVDGFNEVVEEMDFASLREAFEALGSALGLFKNDADASGKAFDSFGQAGVSVGKAIGQVAKGIVAVITMAVNVVAGFADAWSTFVSPALGEVGSALGDVFGVLSDVVHELAAALGIGGESGLTFRMLGMVLANQLGGALRVVASLVRNVAVVLGDVGQIIGGVVEVVVGLLTGDWTKAWNGAKRVVIGVVKGIVDIVLGLVNIVADAIDAIAGLAGQDLGLGKKMKAWRADMDKEKPLFTADAKPWMTGGMSKDPTAGGASVVPAVRASASPALASVAPPNASFDPSALYATVAAATKEGSASRSVVVTAAPVMLNGEKVGEIVLRGQQNNAAASYQPLPLSSE